MEMQKESLFAYTPDRTSCHEEKPLKVLLKLIFNKCKRRNSSRDYCPCIRMSDIKDNVVIKLNASKEKLTPDDKFNIVEPEVININLDENITQDRGARKSKRRVKTIKVKITISEEDDVQNDQEEAINRNTSPSDRNRTNRKMCVIERCEDPDSLVLKTPEKEKNFDYKIIREQISDEKVDNVFSLSNNEETIKRITTQELNTKMFLKDDISDFNDEPSRFNNQTLATDSIPLNKQVKESAIIYTPRYEITEKKEKPESFTSLEIFKTEEFLINERKHYVVEANNSDMFLITAKESNKHSLGIIPQKEQTLTYKTDYDEILKFIEREKESSDILNVKKKDKFINEATVEILKKTEASVGQKLTQSIDGKALILLPDSFNYNNEFFLQKNEISVNDLSKQFIEKEKNVFHPNIVDPLSLHDSTNDNEKTFQNNNSFIKDLSKNFIQVEKRQSTPKNKIDIDKPRQSMRRSKILSKLYNLNDSSIDRSRDSLIIHEIIMEHYQDVLKYFNRKSAKRDIYRKSISLVDENERDESMKNSTEYLTNEIKHFLPKEEQKREDRQSLASDTYRSVSLIDENDKDELVKDSTQCVTNENNNFVDKDETQRRQGRKSLDSGLHDMNSSKSMNTLESCDENEEVEYDAKAFLMEALGPDMMSVTSLSQTKLDVGSTPTSPTIYYSPTYGTGKSVGSSEISTLVSTTDSKSAIYSLYSTVKKTSKKRSAISKKSPTINKFYNSVSSGYNDYESLDKFRIDSKADELTREISVLQGIAAQAANAINLCKSRPKLYGSTGHLEAERILLLAACKMEILNNELNKDQYEEVEQEQSYGTIKIDSLKFSTMPNIKMEKRTLTQYYLCIIHSGTTVTASDITLPQKNGEVILNNAFEFSFDSLLSEVEIKVSVYSVNIRNKLNKKSSCFSPNKIYSPRKEKKESNNNESSCSETSHVQYLGSSTIGMNELSSENKLKLHNMPLRAEISDSFEANVLVTLKLNNRLSGFLTISMGHALWNRRWCALDGFILKYWACPSQENDATPLGIINLQKCITNNVSNVKKSVCSRARTFVLQIMSEESSKQYLLSADNLSELTEWKRQINMALMVFRNWNKLKCQTVLLNN